MDVKDIDYVCGTGNDSNLRYFESKAKVSSVNVQWSNDDKHCHLEVIGRAYSVEEFKTLIETHLAYQESYE